MRIGAVVGVVALASLSAACGGQDTTEPQEPGQAADPPHGTGPPDERSTPGEGDPPGQGERPPADADAPGDDLPGDDDAPGAEPNVEPGLEGLVAAAVADLVDRLDVAPEEVTVVAAELVVWSDPSLGCPHPEMRYRQIPQDGARIQLEHEGRTYAYHSGGDRPEPFLCEQPARGPAPPGSDVDI